MLINFQEVFSDKELQKIEVMANIIWHEHYIKIITLEQIEYMLEKYNSVKSIEEI